jgi:sec-independent protein translocase protein TatA
MNIFGIGLPELAVIAAIGLLVFGPKRLPELGKTLGRTLRGFQSASQEFEQEFRSAIGTETAAVPATTSLAASSDAAVSEAPASAGVGTKAVPDETSVSQALLLDAAVPEASPISGEAAGAEAGSGPT